MTYCYTVILGKPRGKNVGIIKEGESGYSALDYDWGETEQAETIARELNEKMGIDKNEQTRLELGSMFVW